jgi:hypothetical protein
MAAPRRGPSIKARLARGSRRAQVIQEGGFMSWLYTAPFALLVALIVGSVLWALELGHQLARFTPVLEAQASLISAPILAIVGLLLAFSFSMAGERMSLRRAAVVQESNAIGTFWLRTDLVPEPIRSEMRRRVRRYVDLHVEHWSARTDEVKTTASEREGTKLQQEIWELAMVDFHRAPEASRQRLVISALNEMLDATSSALSARRNHLPDAIFVYLYLLVVAAGAVVGYRPRAEKRSVVLWCTFAVVVSGVLVVLLDMDRARRGAIQNDMTPYLQLRDTVDAAR